MQISAPAYLTKKSFEQTASNKQLSEVTFVKMVSEKNENSIFQFLVSITTGSKLSKMVDHNRPAPLLCLNVINKKMSTPRK